MTLIDSSADISDIKRCLGRMMTTQLTANEIDAVNGGASITGITSLKFVDVNGDGKTDGFSWEAGDYNP